MKTFDDYQLCTIYISFDWGTLPVTEFNLFYGKIDRLENFVKILSFSTRGSTTNHGINQAIDFFSRQAILPYVVDLADLEVNFHFFTLLWVR